MPKMRALAPGGRARAGARGGKGFASASALPYNRFPPRTIVRAGPSLPAADPISLATKPTKLCGATARRGGPLPTSEREVVAALGPAIASRIGEPRFDLWFKHQTRFRCSEGLLLVCVPNLYYQEWIQSRYADTVRAAATDVLGHPIEVR